MKTYLRLSNVKELELPPEFRGDDVRFPESLAEYYIRAYTQPGDVVFDPFAGFGTTLRVAERLERVPYGVEFDPRRVDYIRSLLKQPDHVIHGDSRCLADYLLPPFKLTLTSPPYMNKHDMEDPFASYTQPGSGYAAYLHDIQQIYAQMRPLMLPGARVVIEAANLNIDGEITTLVWDIAGSVGQALHFEGEQVIEWEGSYGFGYDHSYALVFSSGVTK